jgi:N6-L-threonylcarbamoyladenine synthase
MIILAIESSCDDCGVAIIKDGTQCLVNLVASQEKIHAQYGGVVPEVASREHLRTIYPLVQKALDKAGLKVADIDALAVTAGPGLMGSLLVGVNAAKTLAWLWNKPVIAVNHLQGHVYSGWLAGTSVEFPVVALVVSGGHTEIVLMKKHGDYVYLGGTVDDAMGEAFDKVARFLNLGYPGGPAISKLAAGVTGEKIKLPRPMMDQDNYDFSFSGLKTAVTRTKGAKQDIAKAFEEAAVEVVTTKLFAAASEYGAKTIVIGGGVAANQRLREELWMKVPPGVTIITPPREYCTDNAAMIGAAAYFTTKGKKPAGWAALGLLSV